MGIDCAAQRRPARNCIRSVQPDPTPCARPTRKMQQHTELQINLDPQVARVADSLGLPAPGRAVPNQIPNGGTSPQYQRNKAAQQGERRQQRSAPARLLGTQPAGGVEGQHPRPSHGEYAKVHPRATRRISDRWSLLHVRFAGCRSAERRGRKNHDRLNTSVPLVPPKPKLFFIATLIFMSRAVFAQ